MYKFKSFADNLLCNATNMRYKKLLKGIDCYMETNDSKNSASRENSTKYGEMVPSAFAWLTSGGQAKRAKELAKMTKSSKLETNK